MPQALIGRYRMQIFYNSDWFVDPGHELLLDGMGFFLAHVVALRACCGWFALVRGVAAGGWLICALYYLTIPKYARMCSPMETEHAETLLGPSSAAASPSDSWLPQDESCASCAKRKLFTMEVVPALGKKICSPPCCG